MIHWTSPKLKTFAHQKNTKENEKQATDGETTCKIHLTKNSDQYKNRYLPSDIKKKKIYSQKTCTKVFIAVYLL